MNSASIWDDVHHFVVDNRTLPILCTGDLNDIMSPYEKSGPGRPDLSRINAFCDYVKQCGFIDLGYSGPAYTWTNKRRHTMPTFERLDRSLANAEWCAAYPQSVVLHLPMIHSDHSPILTILHSSHRKTNKPFRFENWWIMEQEFADIVKSSWTKSNLRPFHEKTKYLAHDLRKWRKKKPKLTDQLATIEEQIRLEQLKQPADQDLILQQQLSDQHEQILLKDEEFHRQRAKKEMGHPR